MKASLQPIAKQFHILLQFTNLKLVTFPVLKGHEVSWQVSIFF